MVSDNKIKISNILTTTAKLIMNGSVHFLFMDAITYLHFNVADFGSRSDDGSAHKRGEDMGWKV